MGAKVISVIGGGEPLAHKDISAIIKYIGTKPVKKNLFTNGTLITGETAALLKNSGFAVIVKCNSRTPHIQDHLAGLKGSFEKIQKGMRHLFNAGYPSAKLPLGIETIICRQNIKELPSLWQWARERRIMPYFETITFQGRARNHHDLNVSSKELRVLFKTLLEIDEKKYNFTWHPHPPIAGLSCNRHFYNLVVTSNGYVRPCVGVNISIGNVRHDALKDIVSASDVLKSLRHLKGKIKGACRKCSYRDECYGCRGLAYHICGDYLAADPICWRNPRRII